MPNRFIISAAVAAGVLLFFGRTNEVQAIKTVNPIFPGDFDAVFSQCPAVPLPFLRSLAKHESDFNPLEASGPAHGLLQVVEVVRLGFNKRFGSNFSRADLLKPEVNVKIACELIARIARVLPANHSRAIPNPSWRDPRFVGLVALAWNAGFSEAAGMGFVLGQMEREGIPAQSINIDSVQKFALRLPPSKGKFLRIPQRVEFARRVVRDYMGQILEI